MTEDGEALFVKGTETSRPHQGYGTLLPLSNNAKASFMIGTKKEDAHTPQELDCGVEASVKEYLTRMCGRETGQGSQHMGNTVKPFWVIIFNWVGSLVGLALVGYVDSLLFPDVETFLLIGSYGATAVSNYPITLTLISQNDNTQKTNSKKKSLTISSKVLLYAAPESPLSQPKNLLGGHAISAFIGVVCVKVLTVRVIWFTAALAVSLSIVAMQLTTALHPPGGATAIIAVLGGPVLHEIGYMFIVNTVFGSVIMLGVALAINNLTNYQSMHYPRYWF